MAYINISLCVFYILLIRWNIQYATNVDYWQYYTENLIFINNYKYLKKKKNNF